MNQIQPTRPRQNVWKWAVFIADGMHFPSSMNQNFYRAIYQQSYVKVHVTFIYPIENQKCHVHNVINTGPQTKLHCQLFRILVKNWEILDNAQKFYSSNSTLEFRLTYSIRKNDLFYHFTTLTLENMPVHNKTEREWVRNPINRPNIYPCKGQFTNN